MPLWQSWLEARRRRRNRHKALTMSTAAGAGHAPHALSPRQQTAVTNLQRHWRGLARRLHVLRKWSWAVSNRLENQEEQRMVELGMFVESIAEELSMDQAGAPSLQRTVEHKSEPHEPKCDDPAPSLPPALCCPRFRCGESHARTDPPPPPPPHPPTHLLLSPGPSRSTSHCARQRCSSWSPALAEASG